MVRELVLGAWEAWVLGSLCPTPRMSLKAPLDPTARAAVMLVSDSRFRGVMSFFNSFCISVWVGTASEEWKLFFPLP